MTADEMKALLLCYWRFQKGCEVVALEYSYGSADVIACSRNALLIYETEVKVSIADLKREKGKPKHTLEEGKPIWPGSRLVRRHTHDYFYFAVPEKIVDRAKLVCRELFPYAGLIQVSDIDGYLNSHERPYGDPPVKQVMPATARRTPGFTDDEYQDLVRGMSNSLCQASYRLMRLQHQAVGKETEHVASRPCISE